MTLAELRAIYLRFFSSEDRNHTIIPSAPLVPENDPSTLFTSSGMQPLIPYLLGQPHPQGKRVVDSQKSFRSQDIEEIGDNRHTTFFEMLGNWSLGDYFKQEQLSWIFSFLIDIVNNKCQSSKNPSTYYHHFCHHANIFLALLFTLSTIFINTKRGLIYSLAVVGFIALRYFGVGNILNAFLITGLAITADLYTSRV